jgi:hypothetical protein
MYARGEGREVTRHKSKGQARNKNGHSNPVGIEKGSSKTIGRETNKKAKRPSLQPVCEVVVELVSSLESVGYLGGIVKLRRGGGSKSSRGGLSFASSTS